jgi:hypothetical protein
MTILGHPAPLLTQHKNPKKRWTAVGGLWTLWSLFEQNAVTGIVFATFEFEKMDYQL